MSAVIEAALENPNGLVRRVARLGPRKPATYIHV
jgi:hypothetical protein